MKDDGSAFTTEELLFSEEGVKKKVPKICDVNCLNSNELAKDIDRFDKVFEIVFGYK